MRCPAIGLVIYISNKMDISRTQFKEFTEVVEDTLEYYCDQQQVSGELAWTVLECLATAKLAEMRGELAAA
tara:strand:+ start:608 stop:820 length:213 start_codon:yes stop_codon:yes gene_type:complete